MSAELKIHETRIPTATVVDYDLRINAWERDLQAIENMHGRIVSVIAKPGKPFEFFVLTRGESND